MQVDELKTLIKELHRAGIEVMLDVVFNHTAEGDQRGPYISFRGIDNQTYYILTPEGYYYNFSRLRQHAELQPSGGPQLGARLPALLGGGIPHRRLPLRSRLHSRTRPDSARRCRILRCWNRWPTIRCSASAS